MHRTLRKVVLNVASQQNVWKSQDGHGHAQQRRESVAQSVGGEDPELVDISRALEIEGRAPRIKSRRVDAKQSFPRALAHLVLAFVFHPTWVDLDIYIPSGSACDVILESKKLMDDTRKCEPERALFRAIQLKRGDVQAGTTPTRSSFVATSNARIMAGLAQAKIAPHLPSDNRPRRKRLCIRGGEDVADLFTELDLLRFCDTLESRDFGLDKSVPKLALFKLEGLGGFMREMVPHRGRGLRVRPQKPTPSNSRHASNNKQAQVRAQAPAPLLNSSAQQHTTLLEMGQRQQIVVLGNDRNARNDIAREQGVLHGGKDLTTLTHMYVWIVRYKTLLLSAQQQQQQQQQQLTDQVHIDTYFQQQGSRPRSQHKHEIDEQGTESKHQRQLLERESRFTPREPSSGCTSSGGKRSFSLGSTLGINRGNVRETTSYFS